MNVASDVIADSLHGRVEHKIRAVLGALLPPPYAALSGGDLLTQHGMDSLMATELSCVLSETFGLALPPTIAFDFPTLDALVARVVELARRRAAA